MVTISLITAAYNSGKTIRDTLNSVLKQNYTNIELIIKYRESEDDTLEICREYKPRLEAQGLRMRILTSQDKGIYDAMNQGIAAASGDIVGILNSDDFLTSSDILKTVADCFEKYPDTDAVYGDVHYVEKDDTTRTVRYYSSRNFRRWQMRLGFMPAHPSFYCRKSTYERFKCGDNTYFNTNYKIAADFENLLRLIFVNRIKTRYLHRDFVTMRMGGASTSGLESHRQINLDHMKAFKENGVYTNHLFIAVRYCCKIVDMVLKNFHSAL